MNLSSITPFITVAGPFIGLGAILDFALRDELKIKVGNRVFELVHIGTRPVTLSFYGLVVLTSVAFTLIIISLNGGLQTISENRRSFALAFKSAGPIYLAVLAKILVGDYLMALKSFTLLRSLRGSIAIKSGVENRKGWSIIFVKATIVIFDLFVTAMITAWFMNWFEAFQMKQISSASEAAGNAGKALGNLFDQINLILKDSMTKSFYFLNGSLLFYLAVGVSFLAGGILPHTDPERIKLNIFKTIGGIAAVVFAIVLVIYQRVAG